MNQAIEIANINARYMRKEITHAMCLELIFKVREKYDSILKQKTTYYNNVWQKSTKNETNSNVHDAEI